MLIKRGKYMLAGLGITALATLGGCATSGPARGPSAPPTTSNQGPQQPAFESVIKDAKRTEGALTVWRRDDKLWLEIPAQPGNKLYFLSPRLETGIGESGIYGGLMASRYARVGSPQVIEFRRVNNQIQMLAINTGFVAQPDTGAAYAIKAAYSPSLLASTGVASAAHPVRGTILVDAQALFVNDMLGLASQLNQVYRQSYGYDARNSTISAVRGQAQSTTIEVTSHYATQSIAGSAPGAPAQPSTPNALPDARSLFITVAYDLSPLPEQPMPPRKADQRVGLFTTSVSDFSNDLDRRPRKYFVNRWRLERKEAAASSAAASGSSPSDLAEPKEPVVFLLDRSLPKEYRQVVTEGVLEWNKAFERIGFRNVIQVQQQADNSDSDAASLGRASIRWMTNNSPSFGAIGPSHVDPRTGEILKAHIALESLSSRAIRAIRAQVIGTAPVNSPDTCMYADASAEQLSYGLDVEMLRGRLDPDSPEVQRFVLAYLKDTTMHEVGHALGLRHNFRASLLYPQAKLDSAEFTQKNGITASVMDYPSINLAAPGQAGGAPFNTTLGPYDYWAIEYAYKPLAPTEEAKALASIAGRSGEPQWQAALAYGTDEDYALGVDPQALQFDLGDDPIVFAQRRIAIARDLLGRLSSQHVQDDEDYSRLRRTAAYVLRDLGRTAMVLTRQVGGLRTLRDHSGSGRDPLQPLPLKVQADALHILMQSYLAPGSFDLPASVTRKLAPDFLDRSDGPLPAELSWSQSVLDLQRSVLAPLMTEDMLARLMDNADLAPPSQRFSPQTLMDTLEHTVWGSPRHPVADSPAQRNLQRDYVNRLAILVVRPGLAGRADARSVVRSATVKLLKQIRAVQHTLPASSVSRMHLSDCAVTLKRALDAAVQRASP